MDSIEDDRKQRRDELRPFLTYVGVLRWFALARELSGRTHEDIIREIQALRNWPKAYSVDQRYETLQRFDVDKLLTLEVAPETVTISPYIFYALRRVYALELTPVERSNVLRSLDEKRAGIESESSRLYALAREVESGSS